MVLYGLPWSGVVVVTAGVVVEPEPAVVVVGVFVTVGDGVVDEHLTSTNNSQGQ